MNKQNLLSAAAQVMQDLYPAGSGTYVLYVTDGHLHCIKKSDVPENVTRIIELISDTINNGLSSEQWDRLNSILLALNKEGKIT